MSDILTVSNLTVRGPQRTEILCGVNLKLRSGEILGVVGETGSGKTTLINSILDLLPTGLHIVDGTISLHEEQPVDLLKLDDRRRRDYLGLAIGYVPQDVRSGLNPLMTARASVLEGARRQGSAVIDRTEAALRKAGLPDEFLKGDADRRPARLSGGQCQRVLIAQAIVNEPRVLLLDEPTASLDPPTRADVLETIRRLADARCAVCLVTHDLTAVSAVADRVAVMYAGRIVELGPADRALTDPKHPYTRALVDCLPRIDAHRSMTPIPGEVPAAVTELAGCKYHPRCPHFEERCALQEPVLHEIQPNHSAACYALDAPIR